MKIMILTLALTSITGVSFGVLVQMPSADSIKKHLHAVKGSADVVEHTSIILDLADQGAEALEIASIIEKSCIAYALGLKREQLNSWFTEVPASSYPWKLGTQIITALLQDTPGALQELKQQGRI